MRAAFYKGTRDGVPGLYNRLVRWIDGGPYSHAELVFSDGMWASSSFMDSGIRFKYPAEMNPEKWDLFDLDPARFDEAVARAWFIEHNGAGYDVAGNLKFVWHWWPASKVKWFCTSAMAAALRVQPVDKPWWYGPAKLAAVLAPWRVAATQEE